MEHLFHPFFLPGWKVLGDMGNISAHYVRKCQCYGYKSNDTNCIQHGFLRKKQPRNQNVVVQVKEAKQHAICNGIRQEDPRHRKERLTRWSYECNCGHYQKK